MFLANCVCPESINVLKSLRSPSRIITNKTEGLEEPIFENEFMLY